mmetsp:Transcript_9326/g.28798  ORF Transcript_9326/g.28798 Transcript_9326/m.28798 type:complete len:219 (+) Transcript_9326:1130-1786(+)
MHHITARHVLHHQVESFLILERVVELHHPWIAVLKHRVLLERISFAAYVPLLLLSYETGFLHHFHGVVLLGTVHFHQLYLTKASTADHTHDIEGIRGDCSTTGAKIPGLHLIEFPALLLLLILRVLVSTHSSIQLANPLNSCTKKEKQLGIIVFHGCLACGHLEEGVLARWMVMTREAASTTRSSRRGLTHTGRSFRRERSRNRSRLWRRNTQLKLEL